MRSASPIFLKKLDSTDAEVLCQTTIRVSRCFLQFLHLLHDLWVMF